MSRILKGSINLTKLLAGAKSGNVSGWRLENGDAMVNCAIFLNDQPDNYGNDATIKLDKMKDKDDPKIYVGNFKYNSPKPIEDNNDSLTDEMLPF